jgi:molecular chaperone GrpE
VENEKLTVEEKTVETATCTEQVEVLDEKDIKINELQELVNKISGEIDNIKRSAADAINRSRQMEVDKKYASSDLVRKLLVPLSYFEGALKMKTEDANLINFLKGFEMIYNLILDQLHSEGLKEIQVKINDNYNPHVHEVMELVEVSDGESEKILEIFQKGFYYKDRVIQPVKVKVSKVIVENKEEDIIKEEN